MNGFIEKIEEPWVSLDIISPKDYLGNIMSLAQDKRGVYKNTRIYFWRTG